MNREFTKSVQRELEVLQSENKDLKQNLKSFQLIIATDQNQAFTFYIV